MAAATKIRCYDYVNHPFAEVCEALTSHSNEIFHDATQAAETRAGKVAAGLHVKVAGVRIGKEVLVNVKSFVDIESDFEKKMTVRLEWQAAEASGLFPVMQAQLHVYPITASETQLDFQGEYEPPLGLVGKAIDAVIGHRIAEASVHHFVSEIAEYLRKNLA